MNAGIQSSGIAAPVSRPHEGQTSAPSVLDIEDRAREVVSVLDLATWIEEARTLIEVIQDAAAYDETLKGRLRAHSARYMIEWHAEQSGGLTKLLAMARDDASAIPNAASGVSHG